MNSSNISWSQPLRRLHSALTRLRPLAEELAEVPSPEHAEWYELLRYKLLPQVAGEPWLVVAVVGGTNIGKSVVFNHLVGENASAVSPRAAGTKHPVCLAPEYFAEQSRLAELFSSFDLRPWQAAEDALHECSEHLLLWRLGRNVPPRLLLLDTPDIDSTAEVNWERADHVRQAADVLVAVLTMQKYNDAAVKKFFSRVADADKPVVVIFNQVDLEADRDFWPDWLNTFCLATGVAPQLVYVAPYDRVAAESGELPFYEVGPDGLRPPAQPASLRDELASLHFAEIKLRTLRGALDVVLDENDGGPAWLEQVRHSGKRFQDAQGVLNRWQGTSENWPALPERLLRNEFLAWWDQRRGVVTRTVHGAYRWLGRVVVWPIQKARGAQGTSEDDLLEDFRKKERATVTRIFENLFHELEQLAALENPVLSHRLAKLLGGQPRDALLKKLAEAHDQLPPLSEDFQLYLHQEFDRWAENNPRLVKTLRGADVVAAAVRPALTATLAFMGGTAVVDVAANQAVDVVITVGAGEMGATGAGAGAGRALSATFHRCLSEFTQRRATWFSEWLRIELFGGLFDELAQGAAIASRPEFDEASQAFQELKQELARA